VEVYKKTFCDLHAVGKRHVEIIAAKIVSIAELFYLVMSKGCIIIVLGKYQKRLKKRLGSILSHFPREKAIIPKKITEKGVRTSVFLRCNICI